MKPTPVLGVRIGDTLEIMEPIALGGVPPFEWAYHADASHLHVVSQDPLRVYASDGGHPTVTATVRDAADQTATTEIEVHLVTRSRIEERWYMEHGGYTPADTVRLGIDLMPGHVQWCVREPELLDEKRRRLPRRSTPSPQFQHRRAGCVEGGRARTRSGLTRSSGCRGRAQTS